MISNGRLIVVLGMHRSGTSAIARGLQVLNANLGDDLMPAVPNNNEKGFWEDREINAFNIALLKKVGADWDQLALLEDSVLVDDGLANERAQAKELLQSKFQPETIFAFKDPRTTVLLPFWKGVFHELGLQPEYVIAVRHPLEVAESLKKRDEFSLLKGLMLWFKYSWSAIKNTSGDKRVFISYAELLEDPVKQLSRISKAFGLPAPTSNPQELNAYAKVFLSRELRHHDASERMDNDDIPAYVMDMFHLLSSLTKARQGKIGKNDVAQWDRLSDCLAGLKPMLKELDRSYMQNQELQEASIRELPDTEKSSSEKSDPTKFEARVYVSELEEGVASAYREARGAFEFYGLDGQAKTMNLVLPADLKSVVSMRIDVANAPVMIALHALSLHAANGNEIWRWQGGDCDVFRKMGGISCIPLDGAAMFLCCDNDPQFELGVLAETLALLDSRASVRIRFTPKPLLETLPGLMARLQQSQPKALPVGAAVRAPAGMSVMLGELSDLFRVQLEQRNTALAAQHSEIMTLRERQAGLYEQLVRAEAQLDLLKEFALPEAGIRLERL